MHPTIFARIIKVDEAKRLVIGRAVQEVVDKENEVFDYETSKPYFEKWSAEVYKDTDGKSLGNVRSMHTAIAAGKLEDIRFEDAEKAIDVSAKIVDNNEWDKVLEGVYTGFSIGGKYVRKWPSELDGSVVTRYTAKPSEISLVDRPCIKEARFFEVQKRDGSVSRVAFKSFGMPSGATSGVQSYDLEGTRRKKKKKKAQKMHPHPEAHDHHERTAETEVVMPDSIGDKPTTRPAGDKPPKQTPTKRDFSSKERRQAAHSGQAESDGSYPIKNKKDLKNAIRAYGRSKNKAKTKAHIKARAKALGATSLLPDSWKMEGTVDVKNGDLTKGLGTVACFFAMLRDLKDLACNIQMEQEQEEDSSDLWQQILDKIKELATIGGQLAVEEATEAAQGEYLDYGAYAYPVYRMAKLLEDVSLRKEGRRNSAADLDLIQKVHDTSCELGAACMSEDADDDQDDDETSDDTSEDTEMTGKLEKKAGDVKGEGKRRGSNVQDGVDPDHSDNEDDKERTTAPQGSHGGDRGFSSKRGKAAKDADADDDDDADEDEDEDADADADEDEDEDEDEDDDTTRVSAKSKKRAKKAKKMERALEDRITKSVTSSVLDALKEAGVIQPAAARAAAQGRSPSLLVVGKDGDVGKGQSVDDLVKNTSEAPAMRLNGERGDVSVARLIKVGQLQPIAADKLFK